MAGTNGAFRGPGVYTRAVKLRWRTIALVAAVAVAVTLAVAVVVVHLPGLQLGAWRRIAASIEERSGWRVEVESVAFRAMPARLRARGVTIGSEGRTVASLDALEVRWRWRSILSSPPRLDLLVLEDLEVESDALPDRRPAAGESEISIWQALEIGELRLVGGGGGDSFAGVEVAVGGVDVEGSLVAGNATARLSARRLVLIRAGRDLDLGPATLEGRGSEEGVHIDRLEVGSGAATLRAGGEIVLVPSLGARLGVEVGVDLQAVAGWWDPNLVSGLEPSGRLTLEGQVSLTEDAGIALDLRHRGDTVHVAGYDLDDVDVSFREGQPSVRLGHPSWGQATVASQGGGVFSVVASLDEAPVDRVLGFAAPQVGGVVGRPAVLSGEIEGTVSYPVTADLTKGRVDLELRSPNGRVAVRGDGGGTSWRLAMVEAEALGVDLRASGSVDPEAGVAAEGVLEVDDPRRVADEFARWLPSLRSSGVAGGAMVARFRVAGPLPAPDLAVTVEWSEPEAVGRRIEHLRASSSGTLERCDWEIDALVSPQTTVVASGSGRPVAGAVEGVWQARVGDLAELSSIVGVDVGAAVHGDATAKGRVMVTTETFEVDGQLAASGLGVGEWSINGLSADFRADPAGLEVSDFVVQALSGEIEGRFGLSLAEDPAPVTIDLAWSDLDLAALPVELPGPAIGRVSGRVSLAGTVVAPEGELDVSWTAAGEEALLERVHVLGDLSDGQLEIVSDRVETAVGPLWLEAAIPLGAFELPAGLWPGAPAGAVRATVRAPGLRTGSLQALLGVEGIQAEAAADVQAEISWDPRTPDRPQMLIEARNFAVLDPSGNLVAEGPLVVSLDGDRLELQPLVLVGRDSRIEASAVFDPETGSVTGRLRALMAPTVSGMLPLPMTVDGSITVNADFQVPAERSVSLGAVRGTIAVDHRGGRMVMRDPPVEIRDLQFIASLDDGVLRIVDGSAEVNRGHVEMGGGWDPASGQGLVLELDNVTTMVAGILTQWDGQLAVEPHPDRLAHIYGDLNLVVGLWDERVDVASAVLAGDSSTVESDDILHDISLDLTVRGGAGIRVENNLGRFSVNWDQLRVGGDRCGARPSRRGADRAGRGPGACRS